MSVNNNINTITMDEKPNNGVRRRIRKYAQDTCSMKTLKKRVPIISWLPLYRWAWLSQDIIAGITIGLTAIPQGIAYAVVAGLSPEYGLYAGLMGGFVYLFFGGTKAVTIGPTAIMSVMVTNYVVNYSPDLAILACFLTGVVIFVMAIINLGFLVTYVSAPVITGFTVAAALQIASGQLRSLFGLNGPSGSYLAESLYFFFQNITTARLWESLLGFGTIGMLMALKYLGDGCKRTDPWHKQIRWFISLGRNAIVVIVGIVIAYAISTEDEEPLDLIGTIGSGLPGFKLPPFSTVVDGEHYNFMDMLGVLGPQFLVIPLVSIIDTVAIARAFADGILVDAKQEMLALGLCNIFGSFVRAMPVTGSFTRTALNHSSGVMTTTGGIFTGTLLILALTFMTPTFYYIPRATLAGVIMTAMFTMIDYPAFPRLWRTSKRELFILLLTVAVSTFLGLEFGILSGIITEAAMLLYTNSKPTVLVTMSEINGNEIILVSLNDKLSYCSADHVRGCLLKASTVSEAQIVVDGTKLLHMDSTVVTNLLTTVVDLGKISRHVILLNFTDEIRASCLELFPKLESHFVSAASVEDYITELTNDKSKVTVVL